MNYGYVRVSTDKQTTQNQKFEIENFCEKKGEKVDVWMCEQISGKIDTNKRKLGKLLKTMTKDDTIICTEISRLSREMYALISLLYQCEKKNVNIIAIKESFNPQENKYAKFSALFFAASAELERNMISQRTKEALAYKKSVGIRLGRPIGSKSKSRKLTGKEEKIRKMRNEGVSLRKMAKILKVHTDTLSVFIKENKL
jgi:DNA invertase Pin-like site-specific DNA recombinase